MASSRSRVALALSVTLAFRLDLSSDAFSCGSMTGSCLESWPTSGLHPDTVYSWCGTAHRRSPWHRGAPYSSP
jgi:hypothetical protein